MYDKLKANVDAVAAVDGEIADLIAAETGREAGTVALIPSENYMSAAVAAALAGAFGNKYAEGYPYTWDDGERTGKNGRYYQGQEFTNKLENLAIKRALELFAPNPSDYHANVQPLSGSPANLAVLTALMEPGDTVMGMALDFGGHLTHGHKVSITGRIFNSVQYGLTANGEIDYEAIESLAKKRRPKVIICGATAYPLVIDFDRFGRIARDAGAYLMADVSHIAGLCTAGVHPHPFPHADVVTTTTHKILRGPRAGLIVCRKELGKKIDRALFPGLQGGPHMNVIAAMAIALKDANTDAYRAYAGQVVANAKALVAGLQEGGFKIFPDGTENHLLLIDVPNSPAAEEAESAAWLAGRLELAGIVANKNSLPGDPKPWLPSGIRMGTPAMTTLGMKEAEARQVADFITRATRAARDDAKLAAIKEEVKNFMTPFTTRI